MQVTIPAASVLVIVIITELPLSSTVIELEAPFIPSVPSTPSLPIAFTPVDVQEAPLSIEISHSLLTALMWTFGATASSPFIPVSPRSPVTRRGLPSLSNI